MRITLRTMFNAIYSLVRIRYTEEIETSISTTLNRPIYTYMRIIHLKGYSSKKYILVYLDKPHTTNLMIIMKIFSSSLNSLDCGPKTCCDSF